MTADVRAGLQLLNDRGILRTKKLSTGLLKVKRPDAETVCVFNPETAMWFDSAEPDTHHFGFLKLCKHLGVPDLDAYAAFAARP